MTVELTYNKLFLKKSHGSINRNVIRSRNPLTLSYISLIQFYSLSWFVVSIKLISANMFIAYVSSQL